MITHKQLEGILDKEMFSQGMVRARAANTNGFFIDRIYSQGDKTPLVFELKPENSSMSEIQRGIGQCFLYLSFNAKIYLLAPSFFFLSRYKNNFRATKGGKPLLEAIKMIPLIGFMSFDSDGNITVLKEATERDPVNLIKLDLVLSDTIPIYPILTGEELNQFVADFKGEKTESVPLYLLVQEAQMGNGN